MKKPTIASMLQSPIALIAFGVVTAAYGQATPDAGALLKDTEKSLQKSQQPVLIPPLAPGTKADAGAAGIRINVIGIQFKGATLIPQAELQAAVKSWIGQALSQSDLTKLADAVSDLYRARGYLARAYLPEQDLTDGVVNISIIEGRMGAVRVDRADGTSHLDNDTVTQYVRSRQKVGAPVEPKELHRAVSLLNELPGVSAGFILEPGEREGESAVVVVLKDTPGFNGSVQLDNSGAKITGESRLTVTGNINSPLGIGDQAQFAANKSEGTNFYRLAYSLPVGYDGLRIGAAMSALNYSYNQLNTPFEGTASDNGLTMTYPLVRASEVNIALSAAINRKDFRNLVGPVESNKKSIELGNLAISGDSQDGFAGGGITQFSLGYSSGKLDLQANVADFAADQAAGGPSRHGNFGKTNWSLARIQRISSLDTLLISASGQVASANLDAAEKFSGSGPSAVRAYPSTEASGDDGQLVSIEWRRQLSEGWQGSVFYDQSRVVRDHVSHTGTLAPNAVELSGMGFSLTWGRASDIQFKSVIAWRMGENPARNVATGLDSDGGRLDPRVWINILKTF